MQSIRRNPMAAGMLRAIVTWGTAGAFIRSRRCTSNGPAQSLHRHSDSGDDLPWQTGLAALLLGVASFHSFRPGRLESLRRALAGTIHGELQPETATAPLQRWQGSQVDGSEALLRCFRHEADCDLRVCTRPHPSHHLSLDLSSIGIYQHPQIDADLVILCKASGAVAAAHGACCSNPSSDSGCMSVTAKRNLRDRVGRCENHAMGIVSVASIMSLLHQRVNGECAHEAPQGVQRDALYWPFDMPYQRRIAVDLLDSQTGYSTRLSAGSSRSRGSSPREGPFGGSKTAADRSEIEVELAPTASIDRQVAGRRSHEVQVERAQQPA